ncbi:MAG TPA: hypothetical protein VLQ91_04205 [Draconibacterium sp.]|nr:hypothetical protein [Draconibacterium sp.]
MKNNSLIYLEVLLLVTLLFSCDKSEYEGSGNIYQSWEVTDFMSVESVLMQCYLKSQVIQSKAIK